MTAQNTDSVVNGIVQKRVLATAIPGPQSQALHLRRTRAVSAGVGATLPIFVIQAGGGIVVDVDGNQLIDFGSGIAVTSVGNSAPAVVDRVIAQVKDFTHTCFMVTEYEEYVEVCEALNRLTPGSHEKRSALFNTGAEAVENAVKIARSATGRQAIAVFEHGYHGRTNLTLGMTAKNMPYKHTFGPFAPEIYRFATSYPYHDELTGEQAASLAISRMEKELGGSNIAAIVLEPIQGEGGFVVPAPGFISALVDYAKAQGILFIADEVQTGFCRTGNWFASEFEGIVPDLITTAKGIAGGMPLAGVTGRAEIMDRIHPGGLGGTYGGNPVACAGALGSIETMEKLNLVDRARQIEAIMLPRLHAISSQTGVIGDVRGRGAMIAVEVVKPGTKQADAELTAKVAKGCHANGLVVLTAGTYGNVLRFLPPLVISDQLLEEALQIIHEQFVSATA
ncbi:MAG: 4-aminobutyrate--2-oxoglutarate transaminase [Actinobacteria bacterium]|nr:4-aminobutyrate--2-oxoglutarate transaminase [Actinomycetota bacterium]